MWPISKYTSRVKINTIENVHITTYKSSKGFEFDTVIIPDFQNSRFDLEKPKKFTNENEIYVALTRCKKNLYLIDNSSLKNDRSSLVFFENAVNKNKAKLNYEYK
jgi:superfamily I DNA/RNA helicase